MSSSFHETHLLLEIVEDHNHNLGLLAYGKIRSPFRAQESKTPVIEKWEMSPAQHNPTNIFSISNIFV